MSKVDELPKYGNYIDEILQSLGYDSDEIAAMRKARAI
jgi:crotonobetainyl-CoA:carnitine CoA-transferase CaiB-like acyl-CoA transferase